MIENMIGIAVLLLTIVSMIVLFGSVIGIVISLLREFKIYPHNLRNACISGFLVAACFLYADYSGLLVDRDTYTNQQQSDGG